MEIKILCSERCEHCGNITHTVIRDVNVNSVLTDTDITQMIRTAPMQKFMLCGACNIITLQTTIAWHGTT